MPLISPTHNPTLNKEKKRLLFKHPYLCTLPHIFVHFRIYLYTSAYLCTLPHILINNHVQYEYHLISLNAEQVCGGISG